MTQSHTGTLQLPSTACFNLLVGLLLFLSGFAIAQSPDSELGFRVRNDFAAELNSDTGWAGATNEAVPIYSNRPFRIRFESALSKSRLETSALRLQYRRNGGSWTNVEADNFPNPSAPIKLDFEAFMIEVNDQPAFDSIVEHPGCSVSQIEQTSLLRMEADQHPLLGQFPWHSKLDEFELEGELRLPAAERGRVAIVFGDGSADDYHQVSLDSRRSLVAVSHVTASGEDVLLEKPLEIPADRWLGFSMELEEAALQVSVAEEVLEFEIQVALSSPVSAVGVLVPENSTAEFRNFSMQGQPRTPRVSVIACPAYRNGASTADLLTTCKGQFYPGGGVSFDSRIIPCPAVDGHTEFEWPLVIRRYADGPVTNEEGDLFEFRMVTAKDAVRCSAQAALRLEISPGHLGGTFVETPGRIGPWQATNSDLYFIMEPTETDNVFMMVKSTDQGRTWQEVDGAHRPLANDLESVDARQIGDTIHIIHQVTEATWYHAFRTSDHPSQPDSWAVSDELAGGVDAAAQAATLVVRSDGSMATFYVGQRGVFYNLRSADGRWGDQVAIDPDIPPNTAGPQAVLGPNDGVHFAYYGTNGTLWYRRLDSNGELSPRKLLASGVGDTRDEYGSILPLLYDSETNTIILVYGSSSGELWERRVAADGLITQPVKVTDKRVVINAVDSQQPGADVVQDNSSIHALFIEASSGSIFSTTYVNGWQPAELRVDHIAGSWVRGNIYTRADGTRVYGYVYDAGSGGGSGMNEYAEIILDEP